jgi:DNA end-binding protein Ku
MTHATCESLEPLSAYGAPPSNRPTWSGLLQLSLVGVPVKAYPAVRTSEASHFHLLHADCGQRIRYAKHCPVHGTVDAAAIVRGFAYAPDRHVVLDPAELDALRPARDRGLRLERFLAPAQLDPTLFSGRSLYLLPDGPAAERGYDILRDTMHQRCRWAIGRVVLSGHRNVVLLRPATNTLVLHVLHYPETVRTAPARPATTHNATATSEEHRLAGLLIDTASGSVAWKEYHDESAAELRALVETKLQGQEAHADEPATAILPLLDALKKSVGAATQKGTSPRSRRGNGTSRKRGTRTA